MNDNFKGFNLFNDIEDEQLRIRNRAVVLANIAEDNTKKALLSPKGAALVLGYFNCIPQEERGAVKDSFAKNMQERGYAFG
jgi:hypothetical protein